MRRSSALDKDPPDFDAWAAAVGPESELLLFVQV